LRSNGLEPTTSKSPHRRLDIQGLRAVAVVMVVAFHAGLPVPGGFIGVDVFFVISGFVITAMLLRERLESGRISFRFFYLKRFRRLMPALALMVTIVLIISALISSPFGPQQSAAMTGIGAILLAANVVIERTTGGYFDVAADLNPLLNTWSLSVEEQFYIVFPAIIAFGWYLAHRHRKLRKAPFLLISGVAVLSFGLALAGSLDLAFRGDAILGFYSPVTRAWEFAVGALLALALAKATSSPPQRLLTVMGVVGIGMLTASLWVITEVTTFPGLWTLFPVTGTLLLLFSGKWDNPLSRALGARPIARIGDWSYSIYLWHWPFIVFALLLWPSTPYAAVLGLAASFVPALASFYWVEQPVRTFTGRGLRKWAALLAVTVIAPLSVAGGLLFANQQDWWSEQLSEMRDAIVPQHIGAKNRCDGRNPLGLTLENCVWNSEAEGPPIYLLGDSNADHFSEGFIAAAKQMGRPFLVSTTYTCPFVTGHFIDEQRGADDESCLNYVRGSLDFLSSAQAGVVIISNTDSYWRYPGFQFGSSRANASNNEDEKLRAFRSELASTSSALKMGGHQVVIVQTVPNWEETFRRYPTSCTPISVFRGECVVEQPLAQVEEDASSVRLILIEVAEETGASIWDVGKDICPRGTCSTQGPGYTRYRDSGHISVPQAIALAPSIRALIVKLP